MLDKENYVRISGLKLKEGLADKIAESRNLSLEDVETLLRYNVITFRQLTLVTGLKDSDLRNMAVKTLKEGGHEDSKLDTCIPFPDDKNGKLFVLVNHKCIQVIENSL